MQYSKSENKIFENKNIIIMNRFYSPDSYVRFGSPASQIQTQRIQSSLHLQSSYNLNKYLKEQNKKIGNYYYNEKDEIGRGFSSRVYKAYSNEPNNPQNRQETYAIKVIPLYKSSASSLQLLQNQIEILKGLDHPNIIKCYDIYKSKSHCYIVTQFCGGGCLMKYLDKKEKTIKRSANQKSNQDKIVSIVQQVIDGVKYLQKKGIVHRDIKPANILKGKNGWKIADFGFAIYSNTQIKSEFNVGTPLYMPLQSLKQNIYSPQSDIFSIGVIFYELLTGVTPWQSKSQRQLIQRMQLLPLQLTPAKNKIPIKIFELLVKLCSKDKRQRMLKQQFLELNLIEYLNTKNLQNNKPLAEVIQRQTNQPLPPIKSEIILQKKLRQNKSMDHIQNLKQKQNNKEMRTKFIAGSCIFEPAAIQVRNQVNKVQLHRYKSSSFLYRQLLGKQTYYKSSLYGSVRSQFIGNSPTFKSSNFLKNNIKLEQKISVKKTLKIDYKSATGKKQLSKKESINPKQDNTQSTEAKQNSSELYENSSPKTIKQRQQYKTFEQISHMILNKIHFCRFLFYMYKNLTFILISKNSHKKLSLLLFMMIRKILKELTSLDSLTEYKKSLQNLKFIDLESLKLFVKTERYTLIKNTINEYQTKYEKQYQELITNLGLKQLDVIEHEKERFNISFKNKNRINQSWDYLFLKYFHNNVIEFLKEFDHNLILTIDSLSSSISGFLSPRYKKHNGFIISNIQGLKHLYQLYRLLNLLIKVQNDYSEFQKKSNIKVVVDYSKNSNSSFQDLQKLREIIKLL